MYQEAVEAEAVEEAAPAKDNKRKGSADKVFGREAYFFGMRLPRR